MLRELTIYTEQKRQQLHIQNTYQSNQAHLI